MLKRVWTELQKLITKYQTEFQETEKDYYKW
jgi:hypothetical protein